MQQQLAVGFLHLAKMEAVLWTAAIALLFTLLLDCLWMLLPNYRLAKTLPGPGPFSIFRVLFDLPSLNQRFLFEFGRRLAKDFKRTYCLYILGRLRLGVISADHMELILSSSKHTVKGDAYRVLHHFLGDGLLLSHGRKWLQRRRILTPAFHFGTLQQFLGVFREEGKKLTITIQEGAAEDGVVDLAATMSAFALNTMCESSMGAKIDEVTGSEEYRRNIRKMGPLLVDRFLCPWLQWSFIYNISWNRWRSAKLLAPIHGFTQKLITKRRTEADLTQELSGGQKRQFAMLDTLLDAEAKGFISANGVQEECDTFVFRGHDTTSSALTFIFLLLAHHPDVQEGLYEEISAIVAGNGGQPLKMSAYAEMTYTDRVIKECLRLYPPVPFITRNLTEDIQIYDRTIPKGTECHLHILDLHRDEQQFPDPERFDPDRFLPDEVQRRHPFAYLPFSGGPRNCIGQRFAMLEIKSCLQEVLMQFRVEPVTKMEEVELIADLVLRSKDPIQVRMVRRS